MLEWGIKGALPQSRSKLLPVVLLRPPKQFLGIVLRVDQAGKTPALVDYPAVALPPGGGSLRDKKESDSIIAETRLWQATNFSRLRPGGRSGTH